MITFLTRRWGTKYGQSDVNKLQFGIDRNITWPHRLVCIDPTGGPDEYLTKIKGCFCRLRMFDPQWQKEVLKVDAGERIVCLDLDLIVTGSLEKSGLFDREETFLILQGANASNPCPFNGSVMMLRAGCHPEVWNDFSLEEAQKIPKYEFPDDQGWIHYKLPRAAGWKCGPESGIYAFQKPGWPPKTSALPAGARIVAFPGWREPSKFTHLDWVKIHWREK